MMIDGISTEYLIKIGITVLGFFGAALSFWFHRHKVMRERARLAEEEQTYLPSSDSNERVEQMARIASLVGELALLIARAQGYRKPTNEHYTQAAEFYNRKIPLLGIKAYRFNGMFKLAKAYVEEETLTEVHLDDEEDEL